VYDSPSQNGCSDCNESHTWHFRKVTL